MSESGKQHNKKFKINAVKYIIEHPELTQRQCCKNLGIGLSPLGSWRHEYKQNHGDIPVRGSGNYSSDEQKEIAHLKQQFLEKFFTFWGKFSLSDHNKILLN
ncbi:transposase [Pectinatus frisingensis]|uniref:transposase n=1 Tax=Pectinatus frisingensis TaxID=865 RepID=UPI0018C67A7B|nr:transposase [Pectinatus frisingensis]